ncbi:arsenate reductase (glutaredoxin) [Streptococcus parauberis]|uniref:arsenate reductase (glutathione/glutaredoxin) n=2 Tax=Streptococcus parauberis TaxID=1348 RepID=A0A0E2UFK3_9STRE|nr:arsenate reductase (glutaredoxin) [Streptococcus parauberis]AEF25359.1 ArsC family protein [Streptococcus parauberis KCTC 11537]AUT06297.1 Arsenate reductase (glutaredoxin) [Streptococcus parauberis]EMF50006.1 Arsenate reductase [Streptococcus parauberis KRS-02109]EMG25694.1 Arsenate reductase [Streptococcus parauberis KRS-02083]KYP20864.1 Arsenate reductase [Streptococcus parauberis]
MEKVTIYHNPNCGTSRNVLAIIRHAGIEPQVIEYLQNPPSREKLLDLVAAMGISFQELVRKNVPEYNQHGLDKEAVTEDEILDAMMEDPILINRPIVVTRKGTKLCRPSEALLEILPVPLPSPYTKEDGEVVNPL